MNIQFLALDLEEQRASIVDCFNDTAKRNVARDILLHVDNETMRKVRGDMRKR